MQNSSISLLDKSALKFVFFRENIRSTHCVRIVNPVFEKSFFDPEAVLAILGALSVNQVYSYVALP